MRLGWDAWDKLCDEFLTVNHWGIQGSRWVWLAAYGLECRFSVSVFLPTPTFCLWVKKGKNSKVSCAFREALTLSKEKQFQGCSEGPGEGTGSTGL